MPDYFLTQDTYNQLQRVIGEKQGAQHGYASAPGARQVIHCKVTATSSSVYYPCKPSNWNATTQAWEDYADSYLHAPNAEPLIVGNRYLAVRSGDDPETGFAVYVLQGGLSTKAIPTDCSSIAFSDISPDSNACLVLNLSGGEGRCGGLPSQRVIMTANGTGWDTEDKVKTPGDSAHSNACTLKNAGTETFQPWQYTSTITGFTGDCSALNGDWTFDRISSDNYTATLGTVTAAMVISYASSVLTYTITFTIGSDTVIYSHTEAGTVCCSTVTLDAGSVELCEDNPDTITLEPVGTCAEPWRYWHVALTPPTCNAPYPILKFTKVNADGVSSSGSGAPITACGFWVGCGEFGATFVCGGKTLCGGVPGVGCGSDGQFEAAVLCVGCDTIEDTEDWLCTDCTEIPAVLCLSLTSDKPEFQNIKVKLVELSTMPGWYYGHSCYCNNSTGFLVHIFCAQSNCNEGGPFLVQFSLYGCGNPFVTPDVDDTETLGGNVQLCCGGYSKGPYCSDGNGFLVTCDPFVMGGGTSITDATDYICEITAFDHLTPCSELGTEDDACCQDCINGGTGTLTVRSDLSIFGIDPFKKDFVGPVCGCCGGAICGFMYNPADTGHTGEVALCACFNDIEADPDQSLWRFGIGGGDSPFDTQVCTGTSLTCTTVAHLDPSGYGTPANVTYQLVIHCVNRPCSGSNAGGVDFGDGGSGGGGGGGGGATPGRMDCVSGKCQSPIGLSPGTYSSMAECVAASCGAPDCGACTVTPYAWEIILSGFTGSCAFWNGTYTTELYNVGNGPCVWMHKYDAHTYFIVQSGIGGGSISVDLSRVGGGPDPAGSMQFDGTITGMDCCSPIVCTTVGGDFVCNPGECPSTLTIQGIGAC